MDTAAELERVARVAKVFIDGVLANHDIRDSL